MSSAKGSGLLRMVSDHFKPNAKKRIQEGKSVISLRGVAKKAMEAASTGVLALLGAAWRALKTASSWNGAQGTLSRVLWGHMKGDICQAKKEQGQREREIAPGSPN